MARKKIREYMAKLLVLRHLNKYAAPGTSLDQGMRTLGSLMVTTETNFRHFRQETPEFATSALVVKPDMLFGKRGKHNLVLVNKDLGQCEKWIYDRMDQEVQVGHVKGKLTHFLIEKFVPHKDEYYLALTTDRQGTQIKFSVAGGIEVEENWDKVKTLSVPLEADIEHVDLSGLLDGVSAERMEKTQQFIRALYRMFCDLDFTLMEMNPWCFDNEDNPVPLDMHAELDDTAHFKNRKKWGEEIEFPQPFGRVESPEEQYIAELDSKTGASLKLTILNPLGRIWTMVAGGGASVVFADAVADAGFGHELANYGEYSGAPNEEETYQYAKTIISLATKAENFKHGQRKALIIGGGIANFTDVAKTFKGISHAIKELSSAIKASNIKIWVRRGGPNYKAGLETMRSLGKTLGLPIDVYGPEIGITDVIPMAIDYIEQKDHTA